MAQQQMEITGIRQMDLFADEGDEESLSGPNVHGAADEEKISRTDRSNGQKRSVGKGETVEASNPEELPLQEGPDPESGASKRRRVEGEGNHGDVGEESARRTKVVLGYPHNVFSTQKLCRYNRKRCSVRPTMRHINSHQLESACQLRDEGDALDDSADAVDKYDEALELLSSDPGALELDIADTHFRIAYTLDCEKQFDDAVVEYAKYISLRLSLDDAKEDLDLGFTYYNIGCILLESREFKDARSMFQKAVNHQISCSLSLFANSFETRIMMDRCEAYEYRQKNNLEILEEDGF